MQQKFTWRFVYEMTLSLLIVWGTSVGGQQDLAAERGVQTGRRL